MRTSAILAAAALLLSAGAARAGGDDETRLVWALEAGQALDVTWDYTAYTRSSLGRFQESREVRMRWRAPRAVEAGAGRLEVELLEATWEVETERYVLTATFDARRADRVQASWEAKDYEPSELERKLASLGSEPGARARRDAERRFGVMQDLLERDYVVVLSPDEAPRVELVEAADQTSETADAASIYPGGAMTEPPYPRSPFAGLFTHPGPRRLAQGDAWTVSGPWMDPSAERDDAPEFAAARVTADEVELRLRYRGRFRFDDVADCGLIAGSHIVRAGSERYACEVEFGPGHLRRSVRDYEGSSKVRVRDRDGKRRRDELAEEHRSELRVRPAR